MDALYNNLFIGKLHQTLLYCFYTTLDICLHDNVQLLQIACLDLAEQIIQGHLGLRFFQLLHLVLCKVSLCIGLRYLITLMCDKYFTCTWYIRKTQDLNWCGRQCFLHSSALIIYHGSFLAMSRSCRNKVSYMKGTLLYQNCCHRSASLVKLCFDHKTSCTSVRICLQLHDLCCQKDCFKQGINSLPGLG